MKKNILAIVVMVVLGFTCISQDDLSRASAAEPGWSPVIMATGAYRQQIQSTPIEMRPYRPFHFYGNTVRRRYYRGETLPRPADIAAPILVTPQRLYPNPSRVRGY